LEDDVNTLDPRTVAWTDPAWLPDGPVYRRKYITPHPQDGRLVSWTAMVMPHPLGGWTFSLRQSHMADVACQSVTAVQLACEMTIEAEAATTLGVTHGYD
jgi:hypothetical protein